MRFKKMDPHFFFFIFFRKMSFFITKTGIRNYTITSSWSCAWIKGASSRQITGSSTWCG